MELLTPIEHYIVKTPMNEERVLKLGIDLCQALEACEELSIIHRDIKPDNIFVNRFGSFKLGDFGIARTVDGTTRGTKTGTYGYMAPEVFNGKEYNSTVDIYSLGIVLYQYLNGGRLPFMPPVGQNVTMGDIENASARRFSEEKIPQIEGIDPELSSIICKACASDSDDRYQSAGEFRKALLHYQEKAGTRSIEPHKMQKSENVCRKTVLLPGDNRESDGNSRDTVAIDQDYKPLMNPKPLINPKPTLNPKQPLNPKPQKPPVTPKTPLNPKPQKPPVNPKAQQKSPVVPQIPESQKTQSLETVTELARDTIAFDKKAVNHNGRTIGIWASGMNAARTAFQAGVNIARRSEVKENAYIPNVGDIVNFGTYKPGANALLKGKEIEWIVLDVQEDKALLISKYGLDVKPYNGDKIDIDWENCTLRKWLNNDFINVAFSTEERKRIVPTRVINDDNPDYPAKGGNDTEDYIFCLSLAEANHYFDSSADKICDPTEYAIARDVLTSGIGSCWWWLRSPGAHSTDAAFVHYDGVSNSSGRSINSDHVAVRPALWVENSNLKTSNRKQKA